MAWDDEEDTTVYQVVVNHEQQYSIWPDYKEMPGGWQAVGKTGSKQECLDYIKQAWTDMRPLSLQMHMQQTAQQ
ncbi:MAG: MbtH family protein [Methylobacter sp.]